MKRFLSAAKPATLLFGALLLMGVAGGTFVGVRGTYEFRVRSDQTTANTKIVNFKNAADTTKASVDIEGDIACNDVTAAGALTVTGACACNGGFAVDSPAFSVANTTGAITTTGAAAFNGGLSVDSPAFVVADTTGAVTTTGLASLNGGIAVDSAFSVADSTGVVTTSGLSNLNGGIAVATNKFTVSNAGVVVSDASITAAGIIAGLRYAVATAAASTDLNAQMSGGVLANTATSSTTTFVLPSAAAGLNYCFVEAGNAGGELLVNVQSGDLIIGQGQIDTAGTSGSTAFTTSAGTGMKNTAATNIVGDMSCITAVNDSTWVMTSVAGVWASQ